MSKKILREIHQWYFTFAFPPPIYIYIYIFHLCPFLPISHIVKDTTVYRWRYQFDERMYKERNNFLGGRLSFSFPFPLVSNKPIRSRLGSFYGIWHGSEARIYSGFSKCLSHAAFRFSFLHSFGLGQRRDTSSPPSFPWINIYRLISPAWLSIMRSFPLHSNDDVTNRVSSHRISRNLQIFFSLRNIESSPSFLHSNETKYFEVISSLKINSYRQLLFAD